MQKIGPLLAERIHYHTLATTITFHAKVSGKYNHMAMLSAVEYLPEIHPMLNINVVEKDDGSIYYVHNTKHCPTIKLYSEDTNELIRSECKRSFLLSEECLLRLFINECGDHFSVVVVAHHMLGDARSILILLSDLLTLYGGGSVEAVNEPFLLSEAAELSEAAKLTTKQKFYVDYINAKWNKEKRLFSETEFNEVHTKFYKSRDVRFINFGFGKADTERIHSQCMKHKVRMTSLLSACLLRSVNETLSDYFGNDIQVNIPVSLKQEFDSIPQRCIGNYCSIIGIKDTYKEVKDFWEATELFNTKMMNKLNDSTEKYLALNMMLAIDGTLQDAIKFSVFGDFNSLIAKQTAELLNFGRENYNFDISNVGKTSINKNVGESELIDILYIPPIEASHMFSLGAIGFDNRLNLCLVYDASFIPESKMSDFVGRIKEILSFQL